MGCLDLHLKLRGHLIDVATELNKIRGMMCTANIKYQSFVIMSYRFIVLMPKLSSFIVQYVTKVFVVGAF